MEVYIDLLCLLLAWHGVSAQMDNEFNITMKADPMTITPVITKEISFKCAVPDSGNRMFKRISSIGLVTKEGEEGDDRYLAEIYYGEQAHIPDGSIFQGQEVKGNIYRHTNTSTGYLTLTIDYPTIEEVNTNADGTVCKVVGYEDDEGKTPVVVEYVSVQVATVDATFQSLGGVFKVDPSDIIYPLTDKLSVECSIDGNNTFETVSSIEIKKDGVVVLDTKKTNLLPNANVESKLTGSAGYLKATVKYPKGVLAGSFKCVIQVGNGEETKLNVTSASFAVNHTDPSFADLVERVHGLVLENTELSRKYDRLVTNTSTSETSLSGRIDDLVTELSISKNDLSGKIDDLNTKISTSKTDLSGKIDDLNTEIKNLKKVEVNSNECDPGTEDNKVIPITFTTAFPRRPTVVAGLHSLVSNERNKTVNWRMWVSGVSTSGFDLHCGAYSGSNIERMSVTWIAFL